MSVHKLRKPISSRWWLRAAAGAAVLAWGWFILYSNLGSEVAEVIVAKRNFVVGESVSSDDFEVQSLHLGSMAAGYAAPDSITKATTLRREVAAGEMIPIAALGPAVVTAVPLAIEVNQAISSKIRSGSTVDIWATPSNLGQVDGKPETIAFGAKVSSLKNDQALGKRVTTVEVWLAPAFVEDVLLAQANQSALALVLSPTLADEK